MEILENIYYTLAKNPEQSLELYLPDCDTYPVLIYFHGGGLTRGEELNINKPRYLRYLQSKGIAVIRAEYRSYPDANYPDFIWDAAAAVAWANKNMGEYGTITGLFVGGSSAGGYLSQMLCFDDKYLSNYRLPQTAITGYIHDAGQPTTHFNVLKERGFDYRTVIIDEASPIYHIKADKEYRPMSILVSEFDMENRLEQTKLLVSTMKHMGADMDKVEYNYMEGWKHCQYIDHFEEDGKNFFVEIAEKFIKKYAEVK